MSLAVAVGHLNASVGAVLNKDQLATALRAGSARTLEASPLAAALVSSIFSELEPALILACALEADASVEQLDLLYQESLLDGMPPVTRWQSAVEHLL